MKGINQELSIGDRIMLINMDGESSLLPLTNGTVTNVQRDPFGNGEDIISVNWDNGSTLSLLKGVDTWKKVEPKNIKEDRTANFFANNPEVFDNFNFRFLRQYLLHVRESGIVNMFSAAPLLYSGKEHIDRYYGENPPNQEAFDEVLEKADKAKNEMISGTIKYLEKSNKEVNIDNVNRYIGKLAQKVLEFYMNFY